MPVVGKFAKFDDTAYLYYRQLVPVILERARTVIRTHAELIQAHIQANMQKPKTGRVYWRPGKRMHIASAPGEAPAIDTGKLFGDIKIKYRELGMTAEIGTKGTGYAEFLEEGTRKMFPRPFALPAYNEYRSRFRDALTLALSRVN